MNGATVGNGRKREELRVEEVESKSVGHLLYKCMNTVHSILDYEIAQLEHETVTQGALGHDDHVDLKMTHTS